MVPVVRSILPLLLLASFAFGQLQVHVFEPQNVSTNAIIAMEVEFRNAGSGDLSQVRGSLTSLDPNVKVSSGYAYVGLLKAGASENVSFAFVFGNNSGDYPMRITAYDLSGSSVYNFSVGTGDGRSKASDDVFLAHSRLGSLGAELEGAFGKGGDCSGEVLMANASYSLASGYLADAKALFAGASYSEAGRKARLALEQADSASLLMEDVSNCIERERLSRLEEDVQRNVSRYRRALSNFHVLIGFFEAHGVGMEVERGVERNLASNIDEMERSGNVEVVQGTEMLFESIPPLLEGRLNLIDAEIRREEARIAKFYVRIDGVSGNPAIASQQLERLSSGMRDADAYLEKARTNADKARAYSSYGDLLFFAASAVSDMGGADRIVSDANLGLDRALEFSGYKEMVLGLALKGILLLVFLGALMYVFFQVRGRWKVVESAGGFHYKKHW